MKILVHSNSVSVSNYRRARRYRQTRRMILLVLYTVAVVGTAISFCVPTSHPPAEAKHAASADAPKP